MKMIIRILLGLIFVTFTTTTVFIQEVPIWVKSNAWWWETEYIDDETFLQGIEFLIEKSNKTKGNITDSKKIDIIVIGAGISGLAAAEQLNSKGFEVVILEARDRTGGRIWSHEWNDITIEDGANWIHTAVGNPITILAEQNDFEMVEIQHDNVIFWNKTQIEQKLVYEIGIELMRFVSNAQDTYDNDTSLSYVYKQFKNTKNFSADEEVIYDYVFHTMIEQEYATEIENLSLWWYNMGDVFEEGEYIFPNGYHQIVKLLEKDLDVRLNHIVKKIAYNQTGAVVSTNQGDFESKVVLVTVPLGVLQSKDIEFSPSLSVQKQQAINQMGMGVLEKHFLLFEKQFWDDTKWIFSIMDDANWICHDYSFTKKPILLCFTIGKYAIMQETQTKKFVVEDVMKTLRNAYGDSIPEPIDTYFTKWASDKFSYGAYSYTAVGNTPDTYREIAKPVMNTIFFAGEHTNANYPSTVHGAYISGLREAGNIMKIYD